MATARDSVPLKVLVPRPYRSDDAFARQLAEQGVHLYRLPVIELVPLLGGDEDRRGFVAALAANDKLIFVSPMAARLTLQALQSVGERLPERIQLYAVGESSAAVLAAHGYDVDYPAENSTSEGVLALPGLHVVEGEQIAICRGKGGRDKLRSELAERGARVVYVDLYERCVSTVNSREINHKLSEEEVDVVVAHSGAVLEALWSQLSSENRERWVELPTLVPGDRVADIAREKGLKNLLVAASALPANMVDTLVRWYTH